MRGALGLALLALASTVNLSWASGFTERGLSLLGYQLCGRRVTQSVRRLEATRSSSVTYVSCGGWIPWRRCPKTVYRTQLLAVDVPEPTNVTDCCDGYEQLGLYCVLPLNRSGEFTSRPGVCPAVGPGPSASACSVDTDCPGLQKCCPWPGGLHCVAPAPQGAPPGRSAPGSWYNVTVLVKIGFEDLRGVDPHLLNHTRLLCSLVTSALQPLNSSVHHLHSVGGDASTTLSQLLLGLPKPVPMASVSSKLDDLVWRVYEVVSVRVQDVDECLFDALRACSGEELCLNVEGSHQCTGHQGSPAPSAQPRSHLDEGCPPIGDHMAHNVTSTGFQVSWSLRSAQNHTFQVQVYRGEALFSSSWTAAQTLEVAGLEAGALYQVQTSYQGCGANVSATLTVKTEARVFGVTVRILNRNLTEQLQNRSSGEYRAFSRQLLHEVEKSFPPAVSDLHRRGKLRMRLVALQAGSVVAKLRLAVQDPEFPVGVSTLTPMLGPLWASSVFQIDQQGTQVQDWDECADSSEHDCSPAARCLNLEGSYTCQCRTARDANPSRAGRACQGDLVSPPGTVLSAAAAVTAPAPGTGTAALEPEMPALSPSPGHLWGTVAAGPAQPSGLGPSTEGSGVTGQDKERWNSTGPGVLEAEPSAAPGPGLGQRNTTQVASAAASSGAPTPAHISIPGATSGLLDSPRAFLGALTVEPLSGATPTEDPTGHVMWHSNLPTWEAPLNPTWLPEEDPGLPHAPDPPRTPTPASLRTPGCIPGPVPIERVTVSNVSGSGFHLAWVASLALRPTFQLTLSSAPSPAVSLETQGTSVALSGLQPGLVHLVELVAKACGKEGGRARLKVRTAAQKLRGQARITGVSYSERLGNASSQEHRDFLQLFLTAVQGSLPAALRQQLDAGGLRLEVTSVGNGSVVVQFNLLIVADLEVGAVSAAFLAALHNAAALEVAAADTFLQDFDECASGEDDCVPGAACTNTLGSFSCGCEGGALGVPIEYAGRPCAGASPGPAPQAPPPRLSLSGAVSVLCEMERVAVAVQRRFLQQEAIPEAALYLGQPSCNVSARNHSHVLLVAGWSECGTLVQSNMTDTVVRTTLRSDLSPEGVIHHLKILSPIHCTFRNHLLTSSGHSPEWGVYTIVEDLHGAGSFVTEMQLFVGESPIPQNHSVSASADVTIAVGLYTQKSDLKVVLTECWATPSSNAWDPLTFGFINNSCPVPNTYTRVIENGDSHKAQFKLRLFSFINTSLVYLHCQLRVCLEAPGATCKINCNELRVLRSGEVSEVHLASWGPLVRSEGAPAEPASGLGAGYVVLIVAGVLAGVAGAAAFLIVRSQTMTGKYSFRLQPDTLSYRAFSD
ncbi:uromodulin-like 1 [Oryctolagus cuniculus]|uniref:uromodulin-like 1 n=1 Tax=Oryctolagus cuniculus TaxID=9986 RepID=UPI00387A7FB9